MIIMGSLLFVKGQIPPLTPEQKAELAALEDREIDYSDIPPLRDDERGKFKRLYENGVVWKKIRVRTIDE